MTSLALLEIYKAPVGGLEFTEVHWNYPGSGKPQVDLATNWVTLTGSLSGSLVQQPAARRTQLTLDRMLKETLFGKSSKPMSNSQKNFYLQSRSQIGS